MSCPCKGQNPTRLVQVAKCIEPTLFHKVERPAVLGDESVAAPETLDYRNVLLVYMANGHAYLYSSDGIPTFISYLPTNTDELKKALDALEAQLTAYMAATDEELDGLKQELEGIESNQFDLAQSVGQLETEMSTKTEEIAKNTEAITEVNTEIGGLKTEISQLEQTQEEDFEELNNAIADIEAQTVQKDTTVSGDASTVTITKATGTLENEGTTDTEMPLPVASSEQAGVMNPATFKAVQENSENIDSILNGAVLIDDLPATPTQDELTAQWKATTGKTTLINRASIYDKSNGKIWYYYTNVNEWEPADIQNPEITVSVATNDSLGIVKGSDDVFVEADGSLSVQGLDTIKSDIANLSSEVEGIEMPHLPKYVAGNTSRSLFSNYSSGTQRGFQIRTYSTTSDESTATSWVMPTATATAEGAMSISDKSKLNSLLEIKSLNDSLELDENGQLSVVGGGSDVNLLSEYTTTVEDNDVYNAAYVNERLNKSWVQIGLNSSAASKSGAVVIGQSAQANYIYQTLVGYGAKAGVASPSNGAAFGRNAEVNGANSVALGAYSYAGGQNEVSIGRATYGTAGPVTRKLVNLTAGTNDTDAVNLKQMQDFVAENSISTEDKEKLEGLANIQSIGDGLILSDGGELSATGNGGGYQLATYVMGTDIGGIGQWGVVTARGEVHITPPSVNTSTGDINRPNTSGGDKTILRFSIPSATAASAGVMSSQDKNTLEDLSARVESLEAAIAALKG